MTILYSSKNKTLVIITYQTQTPTETFNKNIDHMLYCLQINNGNCFATRSVSYF